MKKRVIISSVVAICIIFGAFFFFFQKEIPSDAPQVESDVLPFPEYEDINLEEVSTGDFVWEESSVLLEELFLTSKGESLKKVLDSVYKEYPEDYRLFSCNNGKDRGLFLTAKSNLENLADPYFEAKRSIPEWEPYIAHDLNSILFPEVIIPPSLQPTFEDGGIDTRIATFSVNNEARSIYYRWLLNYILFSSSEECLMGALNSIYPIE